MIMFGPKSHRSRHDVAQMRAMGLRSSDLLRSFSSPRITSPRSSPRSGLLQRGPVQTKNSFSRGYFIGLPVAGFRSPVECCQPVTGNRERLIHLHEATNFLPASRIFFKSFGEHASAYTRATGSVPDSRKSSQV